MSTRPRRAPRGSGRGSAPALIAATSTAAGAVRAATPAVLSVAGSPGPVVGSVCTGYGGLDLGVLAALGGGRIAWCADPDPHITQVLAARMPGVPNLGDIRAIDWAAVEPVEVLTAGFPCQDISSAGRRLGIEKGKRSGLWTDIVEAIRVLRPALLVVENVSALRWKDGGLHRVLGDLAEAGYDALWRSVRAADIGAAHRRERVFLLGWPRQHIQDEAGDGDPADTDRARRHLRRHLGREQARGTVAAGPAAVAADPTSPRRHPRSQRHTASPPRSGPSSQPCRCRHVATGHGPAVADVESLRHRDRRPASRTRIPAAAVAPSPSSRGGPGGIPVNPVADTTGERRGEGQSGTAGLEGRPDAALSGHAPPHHGGGRRHLVAVAEPPDQQPAASARPEVDWGDYSPAVRRWEQVLGRRAPFPTQPGKHGRPVLAPAFVEWLQGIEQGWLTSLPLPRTAQLRALGNGVVPQQAAYAVSLLLADLTALLGTANSAAPDERPGHGQEVNAA